MGCRILGDAAVHKLLINLTTPEVLTFQRRLQDSLKGYSAAEREYQPDSGVSVRPDGQKTLFRPCTSPSSVGCKIIVDPAPEPGTGKKSPLHGVLVVCDSNGIPAGIINAEEVTAFRTSLSALIPWTWRRHTEKVLVFGAGKQALWHMRLALALRGGEIKSVTFVNRTKERAQALVDQLRKDNDSRWNSEADFDCIATSDGRDAVVKEHLSNADAIFCTVPSQEPLFADQDVRRSTDQRQPYISAIGSWQPNMIELDPALLKRVVSEDGAYNPVSEHEGGAILVDDRKSVSEHTGEILQSELSAKQLLELGQVLELRDNSKDAQSFPKLNAWLQDGLLIYKSVGVSLTDLASGEAILELAGKQKDVGTLVTDL